MDVLFAESPTVFGTIHLAFVTLAILINIAVYHLIKNKREDFLLKLLWALGLFMMIAEVFKQWFCYTYIYDGQIALIYFPWQLCSLSMYLSFAAVYVKGKAQEAVLVYLSTFSLLGAVMALAYPEGMLLDEIVFTVHSFIYHALIITESMIAILILMKRVRPSFRGALLMYGVTVVIAELINCLARLIIHDPAREPDMFYINPFYMTTQPVFRDIAERSGVALEIAVYLLCIVLASYLIFLVESRLFYSGTSHSYSGNSRS
ncbi:MAG: YwaF family protein [Eubacterium sp.]|nr:YwaF family protein [Eubacterium sp.]